jgi:hypothetical protein
MVEPSYLAKANHSFPRVFLHCQGAGGFVYSVKSVYIEANKESVRHRFYRNMTGQRKLTDKMLF